MKWSELLIDIFLCVFITAVIYLSNMPLLCFAPLLLPACLYINYISLLNEHTVVKINILLVLTISSLLTVLLLKELLG